MTKLEDADRRVKGIGEKLRMLRAAVADIQGDDPEKRRTGALNAGAWAYGIDQGFERLKALDRPAYEASMQPILDAYRQDAVVGWWLGIRGQAIHDSPPNFSTSMYISQLNPSSLREMQGNPPPGATSFLIGDEIGGCCFVVPDEDGEGTKVYVALPPSVGKTWVNFPGAPSGRTLGDLAGELESKTAHLVKQARSWLAGYQ